MAVKYGFFNSVNGDRLYDAMDFNSFMDGWVTEGVLSPIGDWFQVTPGGGLTVLVGTGKAWFLQTYLENTQPRQLSLLAANSTFNRKDIIVLDFDLDSRTNSIRVVTGDPSASPALPTLVDTPTHKQYPLAYVTVPANATTIFAYNIENRVGLADTPFATGLLQQASVEDLVAQWSADYNEWKAGIVSDLNEIDTTGVLADIQDIRDRPWLGRNLIINGAMQINQRGLTSIAGYDNTAYSQDAYPGIADRWRVAVENDVSVWDLSRTNFGYGTAGFRLTCVSGSTFPTAAGNVRFQQKIEAGFLGEIRKGTPDAKPLVLSFQAKTNRAGNYIVELVDTANNRGISKQFTLPADDTYHEYVWYIPADFVGEIDYQSVSTSLDVNFWLGSGSAYKSGASLNTTWGDLATNSTRRAYNQVNLASASGNYIEFTTVQLEIGGVKSDFEMRPRIQERALCMRYREHFPTAMGMAYGMLRENFVGAVMWVGPAFQAPKRINPEWKWYSTLGYTASNAYRFTNNGEGSSEYLTSNDEPYDTGAYQRHYPVWIFERAGGSVNGALYRLSLLNGFFDAELSPTG